MLVRFLLEHGLLDELQLLIHPLVLGKGRRLFDDSAHRVPLELLDSKTFSTGVVLARYGPRETQHWSAEASKPQDRTEKTCTPSHQQTARQSRMTAKASDRS